MTSRRAPTMRVPPPNRLAEGLVMVRNHARIRWVCERTDALGYWAIERHAECAIAHSRCYLRFTIYNWRHRVPYETPSCLVCRPVSFHDCPGNGPNGAEEEHICARARGRSD